MIKSPNSLQTGLTVLDLSKNTQTAMPVFQNVPNASFLEKLTIYGFSVLDMFTYFSESIKRAIPGN